MVIQSHALALTLLFVGITGRPLLSASPHATAPDQSAVLQSVLDHPRLQPFLHPESPGRVPVVVFIRGAASDVRAEKFGAAVRILTRHSSLAPTVIRLTRFSLRDDAAEVVLQYPVEGVRGRFRLQRDGKVWRVIDANVYES